jgi:flagellar biosynthesis protein FlhA
MTTLSLSTFRQSLSRFNFTGLSIPALVLLIMGMLVVPLPAFLLDVLFTFNIAASLLVIMIAISVRKPLEFSSFPTVLLFATMLRLALNVASTRVILVNGHEGHESAGKVVAAFGEFVIGGNYVVGFIIFIILMIVNFFVVTKGAGRVSEVNARFTLDAMPGKQMAIDADLNAGLIGEQDARQRRAEVGREAEFYGAMDGASKYVRGDAVAGIVVTVVNIIGGLVVGMLQHALDFGSALKNYTLLAIGDGLVAQIPSLIISIAAGIVVSRVANEQDIGSQLMTQLFAKPQVLGMTAAIIGGFGLIPGMPHLAFLLLAALLAGLAPRARGRTVPFDADTQTAPAVVNDNEEASWQDIIPVDTLGLEVGFRLIPLVDQAQGGELLKRIKGVRKKFAQDIGFLTPPVHVRDNLELKPSAYRLSLTGVQVGAGEVHVGQYLAINPGIVTGVLQGAPTTDPAFGLPAVWIAPERRADAQAMGYTVVDAATVVATHLNHLMTAHAAELLGRQEVQQLMTYLNEQSPALTDELVPKLLPLASLQKVLQNLLSEGVAIRDMRSIIEALCEHAPRITDANELTELVRCALGRAIVQQLFPAPAELVVAALDPGLERVLINALHAGGGGSIEPGLADSLAAQAAQAVQQQEHSAHSPVLLVPAALRPLLSRFLRRALPQLSVLSHAEVPESRVVRVVSLIGSPA